MPDGHSSRSARATAITTSSRCCIPQAWRKDRRTDRPDLRNLILCRAAYLGTQRNGCLFWSSDVRSHAGKRCSRQVPTGLGFTATGLAYWSSDTGGWQWPSAPQARAPAAARSGRRRPRSAPDYPDYPELFARWFEYNTLHADAAHPWPAPGDRDVGNMARRPSRCSRSSCACAMR